MKQLNWFYGFKFKLNIGLMKRHIYSAITHDRLNLTVILCLSSLFSVTLVAFRMYYSYSNTYRFLIWNLFLAFIPYIISTVLLANYNKINSKLIIAIPLFVWLIFFPNAPYIVTDLFHLYPKDNVPFWYDLGLLFSFIWIGLIIGFISLRDIQIILNNFFRKIFSWLITIISIVLASFGIYLGRFENWNSWDIFTNPLLIGMAVTERLSHPFVHPRTILMTLLYSLIFTLGYLTFLNLRRPGIHTTNKH